MNKSRISIVIGIAAISSIFIYFLLAFPRGFLGTRLQFWVTYTTIAIVFGNILVSLYLGYIARIEDRGITIYKLFRRYNFKWHEIDKEILFETHSLKFKARGKRYHIPIVYYKDQNALIDFVNRKIMEK